MTAFQTGTATDHTDLYNKLITFLTTHVDLVSASEEWSIAWQATGGDPNPTDILLSGPGLGGTDEVLVSLRLNEDLLNDYYSISMCGHTGVIPSATEFDQHVNSLQEPPRMFLNDNTMEYWFVANGRRFMVVAKISTVYESMYCGFYLPYALPTNYNYPLFIGGSAGSGNGSSPVLDWTDTREQHSHFTFPRYRESVSTYFGTSYMLDPMGQWKTVTDQLSDTDGDAFLGPSLLGSNLNAVESSSGNKLGHESYRQRIRKSFDDSFALTPFTIVQQSVSDQTYGILDGAYHVSGRDNTPENLVTVGGVDHLAVPNVYRIGPGDFWAMVLE